MYSLFWLFLSLSVVYGSEIVINTPRNNSIHLDCFEVFISSMQRISYEAKQASEDCVAAANAHRHHELAAINHTRSEVFTEVKRIKETLSTCSSQVDHLEYFKCLKGVVEVDSKVVDDIHSKTSKYADKIKTIEKQKTSCFRELVLKIKDKNSRVISNLQYCLTSEDPLPESKNSILIEATPMPYNIDNNYYSGRL